MDDKRLDNWWKAKVRSRHELNLYAHTQLLYYKKGSYMWYLQLARQKYVMPLTVVCQLVCVVVRCANCILECEKAALHVVLS